jgi:transposase InsO family protein
VSAKADKFFTERSDASFQKKLLKLQNMKFKSEDLRQRFPFKNELEVEQGVYSWNEYIVLSQDVVQSILESEWKEMPPATGRIKFNSHLKQRYIGISSPQIIEFLSKNDDHQRYRQRRRSNRSTTTVSTAPYSVLAADITFVPKRGSTKYLLMVMDLFSKFVWCKPLSKLGDSVVREIEVIIKSLPVGAKLGALRTDNGTEFKSEAMKAMLAKYEAKQVFSLPGAPQSNGAVESINRVIKTNLFSTLDGDNSIGSFAPAVKRVVKAYNNTMSRAHGFIPAFLNSPSLPADIIQAVRKRLSANAKQKEPNARYQPPLKAGDKIRIAVEELFNSIKLKIKDKTYKASHHATYSGQIFTVRMQDANNRVSIMELKDTYPRGACLLVPSDAKDDTVDNEQDFLQDGQDDSTETELVDAAPAPAAVRATGKRKSQTDGLPVTRELRSAKRKV